MKRNICLDYLYLLLEQLPLGLTLRHCCWADTRHGPLNLLTFRCCYSLLLLLLLLLLFLLAVVLGCEAE